MGVCPSTEMSCYPGCATVGDVYACGAQLILVAGSLAAALLVLANAEAMPIEDFCNKYGTLCAKAKPKAKPRRYPDNTDCQLLGSGGSSIWGKGLTCTYRCGGDTLVMQLEPPQSTCPGYDAPEGIVKWLLIKWLEIIK
jgi:hypothetical protein